MTFENLNTKRLILQTISAADVGFILEHFSDEAVNTYLYDAEPLASIEEAQEIIDFYVTGEPRIQVRWIIVDKATGEKIGTCGFHRWNKGTGVIEMGYDLKKPYWGKGIMTEALEAILHYAKTEMGVKTVKAHIFVGNAASLRLAEKLGFVRTGEYNEVFRGEEYPHWIYTKEID